MSARAVIVSLQGAPCTRTALPVARRITEIEGAALHIVHVADRPIAERELAERLGVDAGTLRDCVIHTRTGDAGAEVVALARSQPTAAVVVCTRTKADPPERRLGSAARVALAELACPVVLVRPDADMARWRLEEVLLPHDGTPATTEAICPAAKIAASAQARLLALHVASPGVRPREPGSLRVPRYVDQPQHEWPDWAGEFIERLGSMCPLDLSKVRFFLGSGETGNEIVRVANEHGADLIVLAWHGTLRREHAQVFKRLLRGAPCPMMVLRVPERDRLGAREPQPAAR